jgi:CheY-like chemotaxis protein
VPPPSGAEGPEASGEAQQRFEEMRRRVHDTREHARDVIGSTRDHRLVRQQERSTGPAAPVGEGASESAPHPVVLLVDDDPLVRQMLARCLADEGYRVLEAASGEEALALFDVIPGVAVVVTDTWLASGMSGVELIRRIRTAHPAQSILRISGLHESHFYDDPPPDDVPFLAKPFSIDELLRRVAGLAPTAHDE